MQLRRLLRFRVTTLLGLVALAIGLLLLMVVTIAGANPEELWDWSGDAPQKVTVVSNGSTGPAVFDYNVPNNGNFTGGNGIGNWTFSTVAAETGVRYLSWDYTGSHSFPEPVTELQAFVGGTVVDGTVAGASFSGNLVSNDPPEPSGAFAFAGAIRLEVEAGQPYGFVIRAGSGATSAALKGTLVVDSIPVFRVEAVSASPSQFYDFETPTVTISLDGQGQGHTVDSITVTLPDGLSYVPGSGGSWGDPSCGDPCTVLTWGPRPILESDFLSFAVRSDPVSAAASGVISAWGTQGAYTSPTVSTSVTVIPTFTMQGVAAEPSTFHAGEGATVTVTLADLVPEHDNVSVTVDLPAELSYVSGSSFLDGTLIPDPTGTTTLVFSVPTPTPPTLSLSFGVFADPGITAETDLPIYASASRGSYTTPQADAWVKILPTFTLEAVTAARSVFYAGEGTTLSVLLQGQGSTAYDNVSVTVDLPPELSYVSGSAFLDGPIPIPDPTGTTTLTWGGLTIPASSQLVLSFEVVSDPLMTESSLLEVSASASRYGYVTPPKATTVNVRVANGDTALAQAIPLQNGSLTGVVGLIVSDEPDATGAFTLNHAAACSNGVLDPATRDVLGTYVVTTDPNSELFFALPITNSKPIVTGYVTGSFGVGPESECIMVGADNDSWPRALPIGSSGATGVIDSAGVSRWYKFSVEPGARATVTLSNLTENYDLAVFRDIAAAYLEFTDPTLDDLNQLSAEFAPSVFSPSVFSPSVFSPSVFSPDAYAPSVFSPSVFSPSVFSPSVFSPSVFSPSVFSPSVFSPSVFSPEAFASAQIRSIIGVSALEGTASEVVIANTWSHTGDFYIRVTGRNGAYDAGGPFSVGLTLEGTGCPTNFTHTPAARLPASGSGFSAVILWDSGRIAGGDGDIANLRALLNELEVDTDGVVIDLAGDTKVQDLQAQAAANVDCVYATNLVAEEIKNIVDSYRNDNLRYVVLVGGDDSVPFFRYPDQALLGPEQDYDPPVLDSTASQASLRLNYILGQDEYGSRYSIPLGDATIPIPDLAVGRVVETASEAAGIIDAYLTQPPIQPDSSLVTGYDFLTDAAEEVQGELFAGIGNPVDTLIDPADRSPEEGWTADDLRGVLFDSGRHDIVFLAGHFSANSALAADYQTSIITTELVDSPVDLTSSIVFSAGCHSGYNIVDGHSVPGVTLPLDWAQAFAQKGATLIAGTGYQYGDTDFVEYSERLYAGFAAQLRTGEGPVSVGEALVAAKQRYLETTPDLRGLHRKSVIISSVFGLPMTSVNMPGERLSPPSGGNLATQPVGSGPGQVLGLQIADLDLTVDVYADSPSDPPVVEPWVGMQEVDLDVIENGEVTGTLTATYYEGRDGVVANPAEPVIPLISENVSASSLVLRGVGFRGGEFRDFTINAPFSGAPTTELRGVHAPFASTVFFPMRIATANYFGELAEGGAGTWLHVTPAQHRVANIGDTEAFLRLYDDLDFRLYYSGNTTTYNQGTANEVTPALSAPPSITQVSARVVGGSVEFEVFVVGDPAAGVQEVWVTYLLPGATTWQPLDLTQDPGDSTRWTGTLSGTGDLDFIVQAVNGVGLVSMDDNFGEYFSLTTTGSQVPTTLELSPSNPSTGAYGSTVTLQATLTSGGAQVGDGMVVFSLGGTARIGTTVGNGVATVDMPLNGVPGNYRLSASFVGSEGFASSVADGTFAITKAATSLTITPADGPVVAGQPSGLSATLRGAAGSTIKERTVYFVVEDATGAMPTLTVPVITDLFGVARLPGLDLPGGVYEVTAYFLGSIPGLPGEPLADITYRESSTVGAGPAPKVVIVTDAFGITQGLIASLTDVQTRAEDRNDERAIGAAIRQLELSLSQRYWDGAVLDPVDGDRVFDRFADAVAELKKVDLSAFSSEDQAEILRVIDTLAFLGERLALETIGLLPGTWPDGIQAELDRAALDLNGGDPENAIRHYRNAWRIAQNALLL